MNNPNRFLHGLPAKSVNTFVGQGAMTFFATVGRCIDRNSGYMSHAVLPE